eukprot:jgi/Chlat1/5168/Chrsp33S05156
MEPASAGRAKGMSKLESMQPQLLPAEPSQPASAGHRKKLKRLKQQRQAEVQDRLLPPKPRNAAANTFAEIADAVDAAADAMVMKLGRRERAAVEEKIGHFAADMRAQLSEYEDALVERQQLDREIRQAKRLMKEARATLLTLRREQLQIADEMEAVQIDYKEGEVRRKQLEDAHGFLTALESAQPVQSTDARGPQATAQLPPESAEQTVHNVAAMLAAVTSRCHNVSELHALNEDLQQSLSSLLAWKSAQGGCGVT